MTTTIQPESPLSLMRDIVQAFTQFHGDLEINGARSGGTVICNIRAHCSDHPKIVGTRGVNIRALQSIARAMGERLGGEITLNLLEAKPGVKLPLTNFKENPQWDSGPATGLLQRLLRAVCFDPFTVEEVSASPTTIFAITPSAADFDAIRGTNHEAIHCIWHAIGKSQGRFILVEFIDPETGAHVPAKGSAGR